MTVPAWLNPSDLASTLEAELELAARLRAGDPGRDSPDVVTYIPDVGLFVESVEWHLDNAFRHVGPVDERLTDWRRSIVEPWATLARIFDADLIAGELGAEYF